MYELSFKNEELGLKTTYRYNTKEEVAQHLYDSVSFGLQPGWNHIEIHPKPKQRYRVSRTDVNVQEVEAYSEEDAIKEVQKFIFTSRDNNRTYEVEEL